MYVFIYFQNLIIVPNLNIWMQISDSQEEKKTESKGK